MIGLYLAAIVAANLSAAWWGPSVTVLNAFLFIGLDLTARDGLHDRWKGDPKRMSLLIAAGSLLSWLLNRNAGRIALASFIAFALAGITDWVVYQIRIRQPRWRRITESNIFSAAVDSMAFPTIAFGGFLPWVTLGQWVAKVAGGSVWAWVLTRRERAAAAR